MSAQGQAAGVGLYAYLRGRGPRIWRNAEPIGILHGLPRDAISRTAVDLEALAHGLVWRSNQNQVRTAHKGTAKGSAVGYIQVHSIVLAAQDGGVVFGHHRCITGVNLALSVLHMEAPAIGNVIIVLPKKAA